jgi:hypothetical protein
VPKVVRRHKGGHGWSCASSSSDTYQREKGQWCMRCGVAYFRLEVVGWFGHDKGSRRGGGGKDRVHTWIRTDNARGVDFGETTGVSGGWLTARTGGESEAIEGRGLGDQHL